ncbi:MAG: hypothetical protein J2P17_23490, partial [Mycobacterium sp.]|nr:hypothetical protein [Mycobacterium sp.]
MADLHTSTDWRKPASWSVNGTLPPQEMPQPQQDPQPSRKQRRAAKNPTKKAARKSGQRGDVVRSDRVKLALRAVDGHILRTASGTVWAWYRLSGKRWSFLSDAQRNR